MKNIKLTAFNRWFAYFIIAEYIESTMENSHAICVSLVDNVLGFDSNEFSSYCDTAKEHFPEFAELEPQKLIGDLFWFKKNKNGNLKRVDTLRKAANKVIQINK
jgi:hypothetical protein